MNVGDPDSPDDGHVVAHLATESVNPKPRLQFSGERSDIELMQRLRAPRGGEAMPSSIWQNGAGLLVQGIGAASIFAMAGMVGMRVIRERKEKISKGSPKKRTKRVESSKASDGLAKREA